jgi:hypothetical protein
MRHPTCLALLLIGVSPAAAKDCRIPDVPPGVRVQLPPGCDDPARLGAVKGAVQGRMRADNGFIDLGNGTQVRIGGRVRAEMGVRR